MIYAKVCDRRFVSMGARNKRPATEDAGHLETYEGNYWYLLFSMMA